MVKLRNGKIYGEFSPKQSKSITYEEIQNSTDTSTIIYITNSIVIYLKPHYQFRISETDIKQRLLLKLANNLTEEENCYICGCNFSRENENIVYCHNKHYLHLECFREKLKTFISKNNFNTNTNYDFLVDPDALKCDYCCADFVLNP